MSMSLQEAAQDLVLRARAGDQNAMAMIARVRTNAGKGLQQAKDAYAALSAYIKANPVIGMEPPTVSHARRAPRLPKQAIEILRVGFEDENDLVTHLQKMCHFTGGPDVAAAYLASTGVSMDRIRSISQLFGASNGPCVKSFVFGLKFPRHAEAPMMLARTKPDCFYALIVGMLIGRSLALRPLQESTPADETDDDEEELEEPEEEEEEEEEEPEEEEEEEEPEDAAYSTNVSAPRPPRPPTPPQP